MSAARAALQAVDAEPPSGQGAPQAAPRAHADEHRLYSVTELANELKITARTLRFYEDKALITPARAGSARVYTARERGRMLLILRGKRLGFSLRDIKSFLDLYDADEKHLRQKEVLLDKIAERIHQLEQMRRTLDVTLHELEAMASETRAVIVEMQMGEDDAHVAALASAEVTRRLAREAPKPPKRR